MPLRQSVLNAIRARNSKKNGKLKKLKKPPVWLFPKSIERQYIAYMWEYTLRIREVISNMVMPQIPSLLATGTITYPDPVYSRLDDIVDDINRLMAQAEAALLPAETRLKARSLEIAEEIARFNQAQYAKITNSVLGIDIFLDRPWLRDQLELFANQNAQLIDSLTQDEIDRVSGAIQRGVQEGVRFESVAETIEQSFGITRRHARLIARDQTAKLNASLTKLSQQETGSNNYVWLTSLDERVRQSHMVMQGKICRWDDETVFLDEKSGNWLPRSSIGGENAHPAGPVMCRCVAGFYLEGVFENVQPEGNTTL